MKHTTHIALGTLLTIITLFGLCLVCSSPKNIERTGALVHTMSKNIAAVFFAESISSRQLKEKYNNASSTPDNSQSTSTQKIRILIVPGHEPEYGGTEFKGVREKDIAVDLGKDLENFLKNDPHYEVILARDKAAWNPILDTYFTKYSAEINAFYETQKDTMTQLIDNGSVTKITSGIEHNSASPDAALHLYGINKWANENSIDIVVHIHFNDYPRKKMTTAGKYSGFSIYVPEKQYSNSLASRIIADSVFQRLATYDAVSNFPQESKGVIQDQELIAIGKYNTSDAPSMLIEYGYIYESQFTDQEIRDALLKDVAFQTVMGIQDFFGNATPTKSAHNTTLLPHVWNTDINKNVKNNKDVLTLQVALASEKLYPPEGKTKNDCPLTGNFGPCTAEALAAFQTKNGITDEYGEIGTRTREILNEEYSF